MHAADQRAGLLERAAATAPGGVLLLQFHTLAAIVADGGWNALRHGHFAYYATPVLARMLDELGFDVTHGFLFDLYGGTVLLAARRRGADGPRDEASVASLVEREAALGVTDPAVVAGLEDAARRSAEELRTHLEGSRDAGRAVMGYAAASRAVPLLNRAGIGPDLLPAVADASPGKQGRRLPGVGVPIVAPEAVAERRPRRGRALRHRHARRDAPPDARGRGRRRPVGDRRPDRAGGAARPVEQGQAGLVVAAKSPAHWRPTASQR